MCLNFFVSWANRDYPLAYLRLVGKQKRLLGARMGGKKKRGDYRGELLLGGSSISRVGVYPYDY